MKHVGDIDKQAYERLVAIHRKATESESTHERNAAGGHFLDQLEKLGLTYDEWLGNKHVKVHMRIKIAHKKLFFHSLWVVFGEEYWNNYGFVYSHNHNVVKTEFEVFGPMQLVAEFRQYFLFHSDNYEQESKLFLSAYIHAQDMYGPKLKHDKKEDKPLTTAEMERIRKVAMMSEAIGKNFKKYIDG